MRAAVLKLATLAAVVLVTSMNLAPRQVDNAIDDDNISASIDGAIECLSKFSSFMDATPTIGSELAEAVGTAGDCHASVPASLRPEFNEWKQSASALMGSFVSELSTCPGYQEGFSAIPTGCLEEFNIASLMSTAAASLSVTQTAAAQSSSSPMGRAGLSSTSPPTTTGAGGTAATSKPSTSAAAAQERAVVPAVMVVVGIALVAI